MESIKPKWPRKLIIVRHGESELNKARDKLELEFSKEDLEKLSTVRDPDIKLTKLGIWQAEQTGIYLNKMGIFDICLSSPYERTLQTSKWIISGLSSPPEIYQDIRLREKEFGRLHGLSKEQIKEKYPDEIKFRNIEGKFYYRLLGGENYPDVAMRVHSFMDKLVRDFGGKQVLIVTHQVVYNLFRYWFW